MKPRALPLSYGPACWSHRDSNPEPRHSSDVVPSAFVAIWQMVNRKSSIDVLRRDLFTTYDSPFTAVGVTRIEKTVEHDVSTAGVPAPQGSGWRM